jgi:hypothetical protein
MRDDNYNLIRYNESPLHNFGYTGARVWVCDACEFRKQVIEEQAEAGEFEEQAEAGEFNMYLSYIEQLERARNEVFEREDPPTEEWVDLEELANQPVDDSPPSPYQRFHH